MKRLLVAARANPKHWADLFRAELPGHDILEQKPADDNSPIAYVVVGRPPAGFIRSIPGLELVLSLNAGVEHLLASGEVPDDAPIVRLVDDGLTDGMVEWVLAHTLSWHRNLFAYRALQAEESWAPKPEKLARERTVTVFRAGALGSPVAELLVRIGFQTRVWSRSGRAAPGAFAFKGRDSLRAAAAGADVLVNLLPLTSDTADLVDASLLNLLAPGAFVINAARGGHIVDADLIAALDSNHLSGAALDVFREEPLPPSHPFWRHPKILVSPHVAAPTHAHTAVAAMAENIRRYEPG